MGPVGAYGRAALRRRWLAWVGLGVLLGLAGGLVTSMAIGARRTESAYRRFLAASAPSDVLLLDSNDYGFTGRVDLDAIEALPQVDQAVRSRPLFFPTGTVAGRTVSFDDFLPVVALGNGLGTTLDRQHVLEGRAADPRRADEAVIEFPAAAALDLEPGDVIDMVVVDEAQFPALVADFLAGLEGRLAGDDGSSSLVALEAEIGPEAHRRVTIVGTVAAPGAFPPRSGDNPSLLHLTPAFGRSVGDDIVHQDNLYVRLRPGATVASFKAAAEEVAGDVTVPFVYTREDQQQDVQRLLDVQSTVLWALGALVATSTAIVLVQVISRQSASEAADTPALAALGMTRGQRTATAAGRAAIVSLAAGSVAIVVGYGASGLWSFGVARTAELEPGPSVDGTVLAAGSVITAAMVAVIVLTTAWRSARRVGESGSASRPAAGALARLPGSVGMGVRQAADPGRGARSVPVRSCAVALSAAVASLVVLATFSASLDHLVARPAAYGWNWDLRLGTVGIPDVSQEILAGLDRNPVVNGVSLGTVSQIRVDGERVGAYAVVPAVGDIEPVLLDGRTPRGRRELVLGTSTLRSIDRRVGDDVTVTIGGRSAPYRVVGRAVLPEIGDRGQLGTGAWLTFEGLERLVRSPVRNIALVRFDDTPAADDAYQRVHSAVTPFPAVDPEPPDELETMRQASELRGVVLALLAGLGAATVLHVLLTAGRRRAREVGTLQAIGLRRRQVVAVFVGEGLAIGVVAAAAGTLIGSALGRVAWARMAGSFGIPAEPVVPLGSLLVLASTVVVGAAVLAVLPGWLAARRRPAVSLRSE